MENLEKILKELNQPNFRLKQIRRAVFRDAILNFNEMTILPQELRKKLNEKIDILPFKVKKIEISKDGRAIKALLCLSDGELIETVLLCVKRESWSICLSSQVGCALGCVFCATGKNGFRRDLTSQEIWGQVLFWKKYLKEKNNLGKITNIVYMGMGEPFLNFEEVSRSIKILTSPNFFNFGSRAISVSTSGVMDKWVKFARKFPQVNLALSLHVADNEKRSEIMPINKRFDLEEIRKTIKKYFEKHKRKIFIEYVMLKDFNDSIEDAKKLADFLRSIGNSYLLHVNLICYNETSGFWLTSSNEKVEKFLKILEKNRISGTIRRSLGSDIQGACGQLAGKNK